MNIMWMPFVPDSQSPASGSRPARPMRPMNRAHSPSATSRRSARSVSRLTLRARIGVAMRGADVRDLDLQVQDDEDDGRPEDDDEQRREDAPDEREEHLDRGLRGLLLGTLAPLDAQLLGLDLEHLRDRHAELLGLDDGADEVRQWSDVRARDDVAQCVATRLADADLRQRAAELVREGTLELLDDLPQRGIEAETGTDRDRQQVQGIRDHQQDGLLACLDLPAEPELRCDVAEDAADQRHKRADDWREAEQAYDDEQEEEQDRADDRPDRLDAEPVRDPHISWVAGESQALLRRRSH